MTALESAISGKAFGAVSRVFRRAGRPELRRLIKQARAKGLDPDAILARAKVVGLKGRARRSTDYTELDNRSGPHTDRP